MVIKIALVCCGLEHIQRGFESFSRELFDNFRDQEIVMHLYKGSGKKYSNEFVIPCIKKDASILKFLPRTSKGFYHKYKVECYSFALGMLPHLIKKQYDIIHCSDNELGRALLKLKRLFGLRYKILFSNGAPWHGNECKIFHAVHEVTKAMQQKNILEGVKPEASWYAPYGIAVKTYNFNGLNQSELRKYYKVPENAFIILSLSALKVTHKRLDWLIKEYAKLKGNYFLIMAGGEDEETSVVRKMASESLQHDSYRFMTVPYNEVIKLLAICDVMVSTSLSEAFGRVLLEATAAKVPVFTHSHDAAKEIIGHSSSFVDMEKDDALVANLLLLCKNTELREEMVKVNYSYCIAHFDWNSLNAEYSKMYKGVLNKIA
jgi:1,2-diacylglycerol 3-alpha-glucosyltransferase